MKETYYKLENGNLKKCGSVEKIDGRWVTNPIAEQCAKIGAFPRSDESFAPPACDEGFHAVPDGYDLKDGKWVRKWKVEPIVYTADDYDRAMEDYLRSVRSERGYTTREPDDYFGSSNPRWAQDAKDWVAFRDAVMTYGLKVQNEYAATGKAPTIAEFVAGLPKMEWSFKEEDQTSVKIEEHYEVEAPNV
jgi:hypothetical protein